MAGDLDLAGIAIHGAITIFMVVLDLEDITVMEIIMDTVTPTMDTMIITDMVDITDMADLVVGMETVETEITMKDPDVKSPITMVGIVWGEPEMQLPA